MSKPELEPYTPMPKGGLAKRCTRVKRDGQQCAKPARNGYNVCSSHGAGYGTRERSGERKRPGRPVEHGTYSTQPATSLSAVMSEVAGLEDALESSDRDLLALKALFRLLLGRLESYLPKLETFESTATHLEGLLASGELTGTEARSVERGLQSARRILQDLNALTTDAADVATKVLNAHKTRADTAAKLAEKKGIELFVKLNLVHRSVVWSLAPDVAWLDAYEDALRRQIYGPNRLEVPPADTKPEDL